MRAVAGLWKAGSGGILRRRRIISCSCRKTLFNPGLDSPTDSVPTGRRGQRRNSDGDSAGSRPCLSARPVRRSRRRAQLGRLAVGGEQQRLAFARLLLSRPRFAILDEATSALDIASEDRLYSRLASLPIAFISIGHRPSLRKFHNRVIELSLASESPIEIVECVSNETPT